MTPVVDIVEEAVGYVGSATVGLNEGHLDVVEIADGTGEIKVHRPKLANQLL